MDRPARRYFEQGPLGRDMWNRSPAFVVGGGAVLIAELGLENQESPRSVGRTPTVRREARPGSHKAERTSPHYFRCLANVVPRSALVG